MKSILAISLVAFLCGLVISTSAATAQVLLFVPPQVTLSAGYSNLQTQRATNLFYSHSGSYADADFAWHFPFNIPLQASFGVTGSGYSDRRSIDGFADFNDDSYYHSDDHIYSDLGLIEIEPRLGLRLGGPTGFFILPRIGAGLLVNTYAIDQTSTSNGTTFVDTDHHTGAGFEIRPAIQAGYSWGAFSVGVEGSYMYTWGDLGGLGHHAQELRGPGFFAVQLVSVSAKLNTAPR